ncbi:lactonase family protein [Paenibacillus piri]|uniref:Lactonase family protein n=2 Tax=Paenibacillus piri TaxID=2547395 RepID=A0A4R5L0S2_9BACL|nr:lactonase family protein [Paenibacillus piri]
MNSAPNDELLVYVGSYAPASSESIYVYRLHPVTGALTLQQSLSGIVNPSFLTLDPKRNRLYAVSEVGEGAGQAAAYAIRPEDGSLDFSNSVSSLGRASCYVTLDGDSTCLLAANYTSGNVVLFPIEADGRVGEAADQVQHAGSSIRADRQSEPHPHAAVIDPGDRFVFVPDLGIDRIKVYRIGREPLRLIAHGEVPVTPGSGPRHMAFHRDIPYAYVINELDSTITAFAYEAGNGSLRPVQTVSALPEGFTDSSTCADIHISPSGSYLYGSNRGHDSIVVYAINRTDGTLTYVEHTPTLGATPRNFAVTPDGRLLLAANQDTDSIVTFRVDLATGRLTPTGQTVNVSKPVCIKFA